MAWYVIFVESGYEDEVCIFIDKLKTYIFQDIKYKLFVPKRKIFEKKQGVKKEIIKKMFPGYILIETDSIQEFYRRAVGGPHIHSFLRNNYEFLEVKKEEITPLLYMANKEGLIEVSRAFFTNDRIIITDGPLLGREGTIRKIDKRKGRAKVEFLLHSNTLLIDLGIDIIKKLIV